MRKSTTPNIFEPHFGVDEAGKGDFCGPLVIAGVAGTPERVRGWMDSGIGESKTITDGSALSQAEKLEEELGPNGYDIVVIGPARYNELYRSFGNLTASWPGGTATVIRNLLRKKPGDPRALSDKFAHASLIERELKKAKVEINLEQKRRRNQIRSWGLPPSWPGPPSSNIWNNWPRPPGQSWQKEPAKRPSKQGKPFSGPVEKELAHVCKVHFKTFREITSPSS
jgi:hypothetical protein